MSDPAEQRHIHVDFAYAPTNRGSQTLTRWFQRSRVAIINWLRIFHVESFSQSLTLRHRFVRSRSSLVGMKLKIFSPTVVGAVGFAAHLVYARNACQSLKLNVAGDQVFQLGDVNYLAATKYPKLSISGDFDHAPNSSYQLPITVIRTGKSSLSADALRKIVHSYTSSDDVFNHDFLGGLYLASTTGSLSLDRSALKYISSLGVDNIFVEDAHHHQFPEKMSVVNVPKSHQRSLPSGPYLATISGKEISFSMVYRLYEDYLQTFVEGVYQNEKGEHVLLGLFEPNWSYPLVP
jgi:hypothetical protein